MPTYIALLNLTDQGVRNISQFRERFQEVQRIASDLGCQVTPYMTIGPYDYVGIIQAPDDEAIARLSLSIGARGNVRTTTMRAFGLEEIQRIVEGVR